MKTCLLPNDSWGGFQHPYKDKHGCLNKNGILFTLFQAGYTNVMSTFGWILQGRLLSQLCIWLWEQKGHRSNTVKLTLPTVVSVHCYIANCSSQYSSGVARGISGQLIFILLEVFVSTNPLTNHYSGLSYSIFSIPLLQVSLSVRKFKKQLIFSIM